ncbi:hypothetical protein NDU88_006857 [Pleurodeles waltl]|uniref:Uncharacterized protein n=1 Tax=Pleurodeles waltl TaxID=8319 RepID=A0AAV7VNT7_PLEWA|nr:hypothetical protein NDU88_006857 [Pleurodeles waltl]
MPVGVTAHSRHQSEKRARPGAAHLTSGDVILPAPQDIQHLVHEEPSTRWSASCAERNVDLEEELLDYEDGDELEDGDIVQPMGVLGYRINLKTLVFFRKQQRGRSGAIVRLEELCWKPTPR